MQKHLHSLKIMPCNYLTYLNVAFNLTSRHDLGCIIKQITNQVLPRFLIISI